MLFQTRKDTHYTPFFKFKSAEVNLLTPVRQHGRFGIMMGFQSKYNIEKYSMLNIVKMLTNVTRMLSYNCFSCIIDCICCAG